MRLTKFIVGEDICQVNENCRLGKRVRVIPQCGGDPAARIGRGGVVAQDVFIRAVVPRTAKALFSLALEAGDDAEQVTLKARLASVS